MSSRLSRALDGLPVGLFSQGQGAAAAHDVVLTDRDLDRGQDIGTQVDDPLRFQLWLMNATYLAINQVLYGTPGPLGERK